MKTEKDIVLVFDGRKILINGYFFLKDYILVDFSLKNREEKLDFLEFYQHHRGTQGIYKIEIDGNQKKGYLGALLYDHSYNVRLTIICVKDEMTFRPLRGAITPELRIIDSLEKHGIAIKRIVKALEDKDCISAEEKEEILKSIPEYDSIYDYACLVNDLDKYLYEIGETLRQLEKNNAS